MTQAAEPEGRDEAQASGRKASFDRRMLEALVCPMTRGTLSYDPERQELVSKSAHLAYPIRNGIPIMLEEEARKFD